MLQKPRIPRYLAYPGNIYNDGTIEDIKKGIQSFRNPSLVLLLNKLGYIDNYGTGIQRILEAYQDKGLQPEFYVSKSYFMVTLHSLNPMNSGDAQNSTIASTIRLSETQTAILSLIEKKNDITITEMSEKISKELSTIKSQ